MSLRTFNITYLRLARQGRGDMLTKIMFLALETYPYDVLCTGAHVYGPRS